VYGPADIPGTGRIAVIQDPQGAVFGVYKPQRPGGAWDGTPVVGRFSWHELMTTDYRAAFEFYRALFGWEQNGEMDMGDGQMYLIFGKGDMMYGGMFDRFGDMQSMPPFWLVYINVKDVGEAVKLATKAGATVHRPQMDIPGGSIAILGDPQGAGFALHHVSAQPAAATPASTKAASAGANRTTKAAAKKVAKAAKKVAKGVKKVAKKVAKKLAKVVGNATKKTSRTARTAAKKTTGKKTTSGSRTKAAGKATSKVARKSKPKAKAGARAKSGPARRTSTQTSRTKRGRARTARAKKR
jgi:predicted enzyme related to lactoylglutathione lyase